MLISVFVSPNPFSLCVTWVCLGDAVHAPVRGALRYCLLLLWAPMLWGGAGHWGKHKSRKTAVQCAHCAPWQKLERVKAWSGKGQQTAWRVKVGDKSFSETTIQCVSQQNYIESVWKAIGRCYNWEMWLEKRRWHLSRAAVEREAFERGEFERRESERGGWLAEKVQLLERGQTFWQNLTETFMATCFHSNSTLTKRTIKLSWGQKLRLKVSMENLLPLVDLIIHKRGIN